LNPGNTLRTRSWSCVTGIGSSSRCHARDHAWTTRRRKFFATLKTELVYRIVLVTKARARQRLIPWFDRYNQTRRHSHCGWCAPITYEKINTHTARAA
jgi:hypothetical protein